VPLSRDLWRHNEAKEELQEVVPFFEATERFTRHRAPRIPQKGGAAVRPASTAKRCWPRRIAGEAGVPFFSMAASELRRDVVGGGASACRSVQARQRKKPLAFIFIDESMRLPSARRRGSAAGNDEA